MKNEIIPQSLAFDMLFGSNSNTDKHYVLEQIYAGFDEKIAMQAEVIRELSVNYARVLDQIDDFRNQF